MATAVLHTHQLGQPLVKLVVAHGVEVEADLVERLDGRLVVEQGREQWRGADHVTSRDDDGLGIIGLHGLNPRGQILRTTGIDIAGRRADGSGRHERAVEVIDGQNLNGDSAGLGAWRGFGRADGDDEHHHHGGQEHHRQETTQRTQVHKMHSSTN